MAKLYITEYAGLSGGVLIQPALAEQQITIAAAAAKVTLGENTRAVRLHADAICSYSFKTDPATADMARMAAGQTEYFSCNANGVVSAITNS